MQKILNATKLLRPNLLNFSSNEMWSAHRDPIIINTNLSFPLKLLIRFVLISIEFYIPILYPPSPNFIFVFIVFVGSTLLT